MTKPKCLDLFAGAGGCTVGYQRAGYHVTAIDQNKNAIKRNPADEAIVGDAMEALSDLAFLSQFQLVHTSPPCQAYSITKHTHDNEHPDLYAPVRQALVEWGGVWVIENVPGVPMPDYLLLCGSMFDLRATDRDGTPLILRRHRLFESNAFLMAPGPCRHDGTQVGGVYGGGSTDHRHAKEIRRGGYTPLVSVARELMGIDWMTQQQLTQAIPPAYTEFIGQQLIAAMAVAL